MNMVIKFCVRPRCTAELIVTVLDLQSDVSAVSATADDHRLYHGCHCCFRYRFHLACALADTAALI
jgi:hypothetical protein